MPPPIVQAFLQWCQKTPHKDALVTSVRTYSYSELYTRANQVAASLKRLGLQPAQCVAINGHRSAGSIISVIAIWLADAIALPVDDRLPRNRRLILFAEARAVAVIEVGKASDIRREVGAYTHVDEDGQLLHEVGLISDDSVARDNLKDAAYITFTSGTSGPPKAILGSHMALAHFSSWSVEAFEISPQDRLVQVTGLAWDVYLQELSMFLVAGTVLIIPTEEELSDGDVFFQTCAKHRVTLIHTTPSRARVWMEGAVRSRICAFRVTFFIGEPLHSSLVSAWRQLRSTQTIVNLYGPSETTFEATYYLVPITPKSGFIPAGKPIPGGRLLIVDEHLSPVARGDTGEVLIDTIYGTYGYINAPKIQAQNFIPCISPESLSGHYYRTGDLGYMGADGNLILQGRLDDQIKLSGARAEPAEIAIALNEHPSVRDCFVLPVKQESGEYKVVAFWISDSRGPVANDRMFVEHLQKKLPREMIPLEYRCLSSLPLGPTGKIDRNALYALLAEPLRPNQMSIFGDTRSRLAIIWRQVFPGTDPNATTSAFEISTSSLKAMQFVAKVRRTLNADISLRDFLADPTFEHSVTLAMSAPLIKAPDTNGFERTLSFPLTGAQRCFVTTSMPDLISNTGCNIAAQIQLLRSPSRDELIQGVVTLCRRYDALRLEFHLLNGELHQRLLDMSEITPKHLRLVFEESNHVLNAPDLEILKRRLSSIAIDIHQWPLFRIVSRQIEEGCIIAISMHHLISDGRSLDIFCTELSKLLDTCHEEEEQKIFSYASYAAQDSAKRASPTFLSRADTWLCSTGLRSVPRHETRLAPPVSHSINSEGLIAYFDLPPTHVSNLLCTAQNLKCSIAALMLGAYFVLLTRKFANLPITVLVPTLGRQGDSDLDAVGLFAVLQPVTKEHIPHDLTATFVREVAEDLIKAMSEYDFTFIDAVFGLGIKPNAFSYPLSAVMFNYEEVNSLEDVPLSTVVQTGRNIKFDLQMLVNATSARIRVAFLFRADRLSTPELFELGEAYLLIIDAFLSK